MNTSIRTPVFFLTLIVLAMGASGCSFSLKKSGVADEDSTSSDQSASPASSAGGVDFATIKKQILQPNCLSCHGGREEPVLLTYDQVKANLAAIENEVLVEKAMPKAGPLSDSKQTTLRAWIDAGAPETVAAADSGVTVTPSPAPSQAASGIVRPVTFATLKEKVLEPSCVSCHYAGSVIDGEAMTSLQTYEEVKSVDGTFWANTIYQSAMPPLDSPGAEPLTTEQKDIISLWFSDGMKE